MSNLRATCSLTDLGQNLRRARLSRRFSTAELAARADLSGRALIWLGKDDPGVGIGNLAALGSPEGLLEIMAPVNDPVGLARALDSVSKRGRSIKAGKVAGVQTDTGRVGSEGIAVTATPSLDSVACWSTTDP